MTLRPRQIDELELKPINPDSPVPLYHQIESNLRHLISTGQLTPGELLPPEIELSQAYGVGRHTIRMALSRLVSDDLIARRAGHGTYIRSQEDRQNFYLDRSFTRQMADMGKVASSRLLETSQGIVDEYAPKCLHHREGEPYYRIFRLRLGDDEPIGLQSTTILTKDCPGIREKDFSQVSLFEVLTEDYQLVITRLDHSIRAQAANQFQAGLLKVHEEDPLLLVNSTSYLDTGKIIETTTSYYRADRYEFRTTDSY